ADDALAAVGDGLGVDRRVRAGGEPDEDDRAASADERQRLLDRLAGAGGDEGVVEAAPAGELGDGGPDVVAGAVERVGGAERTRRLELVVDEVDGDDAARAGEDGALHGV